MANTEIVRISAEWLDTNKSRAYPFSDECADSPGRVPSPVFTDAFFSVKGLGGEPLYVSRIVQGQTSFQVYMSTESVEIGLVADIPYSTADRTQVPIDITTDEDITITGFFVIGDAKAIMELPADNPMNIDNGKLFYGCVREFEIIGVTGIQVGDTIYKGVVNLEAGEGVDISVSQEEGETTITINAKGREVPEENLIIVDDQTLLKEITELYGTPVTMINGIVPDASGNIVLAYPLEDGTGYSPFPSEVGTIILQDSSGSSIDCENALVDTIMANIAELNEREAQHASSINSLDTANNVMSVSLSRLS